VAFRKDVKYFIDAVTSIWNCLVEGRWDMKYFKSSLQLFEINRNKDYAKPFLPIREWSVKIKKKLKLLTEELYVLHTEN